jgi:hypothetical protein
MQALCFPTGGHLGGVAGVTRESWLLCYVAGFDVILVETVGVGSQHTKPLPYTALRLSFCAKKRACRAFNIPLQHCCCQNPLRLLHAYRRCCTPAASRCWPTRSTAHGKPASARATLRRRGYTFGKAAAYRAPMHYCTLAFSVTLLRRALLCASTRVTTPGLRLAHGQSVVSLADAAHPRKPAFEQIDIITCTLPFRRGQFQRDE